MIQLNEEQITALEGALTFAGHAVAGGKNFLTVQGLAGTGKTTMMSQLASKIPNCVIVAPTGKAAAVLRAKSGLDVKTIHAAIYDFRGMVEDEEDANGRMRPVFADKHGAHLLRKIVLADESSMIGTKLAEDLLKTGAIVIACGDPGQLPPVRDKQFFQVADHTLKTIHRQALESPIIRQAHAVRSTGTYASDGEGFKTATSSFDLDVTKFDVVLCWKNATRRTLNNRVRKAKGIAGMTILPGEPVMCLRNDYRFGVFNGEVYTVKSMREPGRMISLTNGMDIPGAAVEGFDSDFDDAVRDEDRTPFAMAYCVTAHKSQGSEWPSVLVFDEMPSNNPDRSRWLYTAITRASDHVTVVRPVGW